MYESNLKKAWSETADEPRDEEEKRLWWRNREEIRKQKAQEAYEAGTDIYNSAMGVKPGDKELGPTGPEPWSLRSPLNDVGTIGQGGFVGLLEQMRDTARVVAPTVTTDEPMTDSLVATIVQKLQAGLDAVSLKWNEATGRHDAITLISSTYIDGKEIPSHTNVEQHYGSGSPLLQSSRGSH
jgi:hypothetical protein